MTSGQFLAGHNPFPIQDTSATSGTSIRQSYKPAPRPINPKIKSKHFKVSLYDSAGILKSTQSKTIFTVRDPDAIVLAPHFTDTDGRPKIVMYRRINPLSGQAEITLPKRYMSEKNKEDRLGLAVDRLISKIGVTPDGPSRMTSSPFIVLPGSFPYVNFSFECSIKPINELPGFYDPYYGTVDLLAVSSQSLIENLMRGCFQDPNALRTAIALERPDRAHAYIPHDVKSLLSNSTAQTIDAGWSIDSNKLDEYVWKHPPTEVPTQIQSVRMKSHKDANFCVKDRIFERKISDNEFTHRCHVESIESTTGKNHQVVIFGYIKARDSNGRGDLYCLVNIGSRALTVRQLSNNPIQSEKSDYNVEPWWYYSSSTPSAEEVAKQMQQLSGIQAMEQPVFLGSFKPNPEFVSITCDCFLMELDASTFDNTPNEPGLFQTLIPLSELKTSLANGIVRSAPLAVFADILDAAADYRADTIEPFRLKEDEERYLTMMQRGSHYRDFLQKHFSKQFEALNDSSTFRRVLEEVFNHGFGLKDNGDQFYSSIIEYGLLDSLPTLNQFILLLHDWYHGIQGDLIPWNFTDNPPKLISLKDYTKGILLNEAQAVYFSDVFLAKRYGYQKWREDGGSISLGEALFECGIVSEAQQRQATISLVRDGIIPENIKNHPNYNECKHPIEFFRRFHDRDVHISKTAYEYWKHHPEVARVVLDFNKRCCSEPKAHTATVRSAIKSIRAEKSRGINPLRHELFELKDLTLLKLAIRCSYIADETDNPLLKEEALSVCDQLRLIQTELNMFDELIHGVHPSAQNANVFNRIFLLKELVLKYETNFKSTLIKYDIDPKSIDELFSMLPLWAAPFEIDFAQ